MAISELNILVRRCIHRRISPANFHSILQQYRLRAPFTSSELTASILNASVNFCLEGDPILPPYLQVLLLHNSITLSSLITGLIRLWKTGNEKVIPVEAFLISNLSLTNASQVEIDKCISLTARWLNALVSSEKHPLVEAVGFLLTNLINPLQTKSTYNEVQHVVEKCMSTFPNIAMQLMNKMSTIPKPMDESMLDIAAFQFEANIHDAQIVPVRTATTAYLQSQLRKFATIDDSVVFSFLSTRYQDNHALMFNELVFATMEAKTKSTHDLYQTQWQHFLLDKLPSILAFISSSAFGGFSSETILNEACTTLDIDLAKKFLQICSFHQLTTSQEDTTLKGLYAKDDLVNQVVANHSRGPRLVDELLKKDGNAANISHAISDIMHNYCISKDTQHLKDMANAIVRKPASINIIAMFIKATTFLAPFCLLLDEWKWDDIHGESQPVYDEFGSIFLLVVVFKNRLDCEMPSNGFVARYFSLRNSELPDPQYLGDWIQSLYIDEGLSDELTTKCSAHDFYLLVPTLMRQSTLARAKGKLTNTAFSTGLSYLLESFLLPSLVPALGWIERIAESEPSVAKQVLQVFTVEPSTSEAREIHQTILSMATSQMKKLSLDSSLKTILASSKYGDFNLPSEKVGLALADVVTQTGQTSYIDDALSTAVEKDGPEQVLHTLVNVLIQYSGTRDFHAILDFEATIIACDPDLRHSLQLMHANLARYIKKGDNLNAEAIVHLFRRVELYGNTLVAQVQVVDHGFVPMIGMNVANINLDAGPAASFEQIDQNEDIDQVLNEAAAMGGMDQMGSNTFDDMYGFPGGDLNLENLDDLDLDLF